MLRCGRLRVTGKIQRQQSLTAKPPDSPNNTYMGLLFRNVNGHSDCCSQAVVLTAYTRLIKLTEWNVSRDEHAVYSEKCTF